jgi:hypothetical protein
LLEYDVFRNKIFQEKYYSIGNTSIFDAEQLFFCCTGAFDSRLTDQGMGSSSAGQFSQS